MDPVSVGVLVSALVSGAAGQVGEDVSEEVRGVLGRLVARLRSQFSADGDVAGVAALERVVEVPDSPSRQVALAEAVAELVKADRSFGDELVALVDEAQQAGVDVGVVTQSIVNASQAVQNANVRDSTINVSFGHGSSGRD